MDLNDPHGYDHHHHSRTARDVLSSSAIEHTSSPVDSITASSHPPADTLVPLASSVASSDKAVSAPSSSSSLSDSRTKLDTYFDCIRSTTAQALHPFVFNDASRSRDPSMAGTSRFARLVEQAGTHWDENNASISSISSSSSSSSPSSLPGAVWNRASTVDDSAWSSVPRTTSAPSFDKSSSTYQVPPPAEGVSVLGRSHHSGSNTSLAGIESSLGPHVDPSVTMSTNSGLPPSTATNQPAWTITADLPSSSSRFSVDAAPAASWQNPSGCAAPSYTNPFSAVGQHLSAHYADVCSSSHANPPPGVSSSGISYPLPDVRQGPAQLKQDSYDSLGLSAPSRPASDPTAALPSSAVQSPPQAAAGPPHASAGSDPYQGSWGDTNLRRPPPASQSSYSSPTGYHRALDTIYDETRRAPTRAVPVTVADQTRSAVYTSSLSPVQARLTKSSVFPPPSFRAAVSQSPTSSSSVPTVHPASPSTTYGPPGPLMTMPSARKRSYTDPYGPDDGSSQDLGPGAGVHAMSAPTGGASPTSYSNWYSGGHLPTPPAMASSAQSSYASTSCGGGGVDLASTSYASPTQPSSFASASYSSYPSQRSQPSWTPGSGYSTSQTSYFPSQPGSSTFHSGGAYLAAGPSTHTPSPGPSPSWSTSPQGSSSTAVFSASPAISQPSSSFPSSSAYASHYAPGTQGLHQYGGYSSLPSGEMGGKSAGLAATAGGGKRYEINPAFRYTAEVHRSHNASTPPASDFETTDPDAVPRQQTDKVRFDGDLYTPLWVRYTSNAREGWCDLCENGGWFQLKNSQFWYHKQNTHGISAISGRPFAPPLETRVSEAGDMLEGRCHQCDHWIAMANMKRRRSFVAWYRHAHQCHSYRKASATSAFLDSKRQRITDF